MGTFTTPELTAHIERLEAKLEQAEFLADVGEIDPRALTIIRRALTRFRFMLNERLREERLARR